ncbi:RNA polymerase II subunit A C-terminal domain phosphatase SSU72 [Tetrabaena socialis]|uniref:RNA polymerase II subunit A C-terminal domain phosphatase SSU72 n=1 Tax=Tetrabaena socialis TaxID=47790 RepID=A0A2J7ZUR7_9CHLO|nr:RNA polymerase II subunit A C-terminal domain phosphatase SSU72 [Tetrabaena socialis]|eukprot:PNH04002.1 RNA polymerase II subunit A C-terminal domain phosphatase SSU72 [Tetrabaena socialis]
MARRQPPNRQLPTVNSQPPAAPQFGTPYATIHDDLAAKDPELYQRKGLLQMLRRNMGVKAAPERYQDNRDQFDVVLTFEERVMEQVIEDMAQRPQVTLQPVLVCNMDVTDNHEEAATAAPQALKLCQMLEAGGDWEDCVDGVVAQFQHETGRRLTYTVCYY